MAAVVKSELKRYIDRGHDVDTHEKMFEAVHDKRLLVGLSVYYLDIVVPETPLTHWKISKITDYLHFDFETSSFVRVWKYYGIGRGKVLRVFTGVGGDYNILLTGGRHWQKKRMKKSQKLRIEKKQSSGITDLT